MVISFVLGVIPLLGIAWIVMTGWIATVDGLFMTLILLALSGILMLNALMEARARGLLKLPLKKSASAKTAETQPAKVQAQKTG